jgi:polyphosphate:AMP phosphotransferase
MDEHEYRQRSRELRRDLLEAQREIESASVATLLLLAGVDAGGKGDSVNMLMAWLDPRSVATRAFDRPTDEEGARPRFWRYWRVLPPRGHLGVFMSAWYSQPLLRRVHGANSTWFEEEMDRIRTLEQTLADDGYAIGKIWLHLDADAQKERFLALEADPETSWRVTRSDWENWRRYDDFARATDEIIEATHTRQCPWHVIDGQDRHRRRIEVGKALLGTFRGQREGSEGGTPTFQRVRPNLLEMPQPSDRSRIPRAEYRSEMFELQRELNALHRQAREESVSLIVVFEGRDAAGKGGAIRRVVPAFDARTVDVVRIGPPTDEERAHHYLWRFWRRLPPAGHVTLFDRSWYGRVLVERVEKLASSQEWMRAYDEIVDFERQLVESGAVVVKFWLHIDAEEQGRRFEERRKVALKRWKLTDDDLRNRSMWDAYETAINDTVARTDAEIAPWRFVHANDKRAARLEVLRTLRDRLSDRLSGYRANDSRQVESN